MDLDDAAAEVGKIIRDAAATGITDTQLCAYALSVTQRFQRMISANNSFHHSIARMHDELRGMSQRHNAAATVKQRS